MWNGLHPHVAFEELRERDGDLVRRDAARTFEFDNPWGVGLQEPVGGDAADVGRGLWMG